MSDLINQIINIRFNIEWDEGGEKKQEQWKLPFRFFFRYELEHIIERSKFDKYKITGYDIIIVDCSKISMDIKEIRKYLQQFIVND